MGDYHKAPTTLYNLDGETKRCKTQGEVDRAWEDGWYGPPWLVRDVPLLSTKTWRTKAALIREVEDDPRYEGLRLSSRERVTDLMATIHLFELENEVEAFLKE